MFHAYGYQRTVGAVKTVVGLSVTGTWWAVGGVSPLPAWGGEGWAHFYSCASPDPGHC